MPPERFVPSNETEIVEEIVEKVEHHINETSGFLQDREVFMDMYNGVPRLIPNKFKEDDKLSRIAAPVTLESVETLTNALFTMLTSADPNFEFISMRGDVTSEDLYKLTQIQRFENDKIKFKRKLMKALRSLVLNGTVFIEEPYISFPSGWQQPMWEATDFVVRPFSQMFWAPTMDFDSSDYMGPMDVVTAGQLNALAGMDQEGSTWLKDNLMIALKKHESDPDKFTASEIKRRLTTLGYQDFKNFMELITYWGPLNSVKDGPGGDYVVGVLNRKHLVRFHTSPYPPGMRPFRIAHHIETENEPLGRGVGHQLKDIHKQINSILNRSADVVTFNVLSQFFVSRYAGLRTSQLKVRPWQFIEVDDPSGITPVKADINSATAGVKIYEMLLELARNSTGATPTLQAVITEASASEVRIAQNNSMRRVSNEAEVVAEDLLRAHYQFAHFNRGLFMDQPVWVNTIGIDRPMMIYPADVRKQVDIVPRLVTDKDFAPQMIKNSITLLQTLTSVRNMIPDDINIRPVVGEIVRRLGIDPSQVFIPRPAAPVMADPRVMQGMADKEAALAGGSAASPNEMFNEALGGVDDGTGGPQVPIPVG